MYPNLYKRLKTQKEDLIEFWTRTKIITDKNIIRAFKEIGRERFLTDDQISYAYDDKALPFIEGQTVSQPTTVVMMLEALEIKPKHKILEIGAGSGYNAALISKLADTVYSLEIIKEVAEAAKKNIDKTGIKNVKIIHADGSAGYKLFAPYDRIIITAACPRIPKEMIEQLNDKGIIVAPVGKRYRQKMIKLKKTEKSGQIKLKKESLGDFIFVPLRGKKGLGV